MVRKTIVLTNCPGVNSVAILRCRDVSKIPPGTNSTGMIVLGFLDAGDPNNEHLDLSM